MMRFLFRKRFKQSLKRSFGLFVVFAMVLQSVGLPGLTTIVLASEGNGQPEEMGEGENEMEEGKKMKECFSKEEGKSVEDTKEQEAEESSDEKEGNDEDSSQEEGEKTNLDEYKDTLGSVDEDDYTGASWKAYQDEVKKNEVSEDNSQAEVDEAVKNIQEAQKDLVEKADTSKYEALLAEIDNLSEDTYTQASWKRLQDSLKANEVDENDTQERVNEAVKNIKDAKGGLVQEVSDEGGLDLSPEAGGAILDTAASTGKDVTNKDKDSQKEENTEKSGEDDDTEKDVSQWIQDAQEKGYEIIEVEEGEEYIWRRRIFYSSYRY